MATATEYRSETASYNPVNEQPLAKDEKAEIGNFEVVARNELKGRKRLGRVRMALFSMAAATMAFGAALIGGAKETNAQYVDYWGQNPYYGTCYGTVDRYGNCRPSYQYPQYYQQYPSYYPNYSSYYSPNYGSYRQYYDNYYNYYGGNRSYYEMTPTTIRTGADQYRGGSWHQGSGYDRSYSPSNPYYYTPYYYGR